MSAESKITFKTSDVRVEKDYNADEFPVPAVTFSITSERQDPVIVTITDIIPEELGMDQIGFHPDYGNEHWTAYQEGRVEYEHELKPEESLMTLYGVNLDDPEQAELFMTEPTVEVVPVDEYKYDEEGETEEEQTIDDTTMENIPEQESTDIVREVLQGDRNNVPGLEGQPTEIEMGEEDSSEDHEHSQQTAQRQLTIIEALVSEIRSGEVDETNLEFLRQELSTVTPSTETRLGHLQSRMSDLEAYTDSMEELIDQHENMQNQLGTFEDRFANLADRMDSLEHELEESKDEQEAIQQSLDTMETDIKNLEDSVNQVTDDLATLEEEIENMGNYDEEINELEDEIDELEDEIDDIDEFEEALNELEDDIEDINEDIQDLKVWREQLAEMF